MLGKDNSKPERIISFAMTVFGVSLVLIAIFLNKNVPKDFMGIVKFIYSAVL